MTPSNLVAALFSDDVSARDAIADLRLAGFVASNIGVALSEEGKRASLSLAKSAVCFFICIR